MRLFGKGSEVLISNQILQTTIDGLKTITRREICVVEREGKVVASTEEDMHNSVIKSIELFVDSPAENQLVAGFQYFKVFDNGNIEYIVLIKGEDEETFRIGKMAAFQIQSLLVAYKERYDKDNFIKNLLLDNLLLVDIYSRAKKLHIENNVRRIVYLIETELDKDLNIVEIVRSIFPTKMRDFVTAVDERSIILVKELKDSTGMEEIENIAKTIYDTLIAEAMSNIYESNHIVNYKQLGIGRLIYQLPTTLCRMFISEVLHGLTMDQFDDETLTTVNKFFDNNLNVSETSRQLYIHRNTLVYRLDKLQKMTGLDLRNFDDAIVFKIMLMVSKYMSYKESLRF